MMSHGMTLLALTSTTDERWANTLAALLAVHPIRPGEGEDDYIAVVLNAKLCHMELCVANFRSQLRNAGAKWIEKGRLCPKKAGAKHNPALKVVFLKHFTPPY